MSGGQLRVWSILGVLSFALVLAGAEGPARAQSEYEDGPVAGSTRVPLLEDKISDQDAALGDMIQEISTVGAQLDRAQRRVDDAGARVEYLRSQTRQLKLETPSLDAAFRKSQSRYRAHVYSPYTNESPESLAA